jgi:hypothetical protein
MPISPALLCYPRAPLRRDVPTRVATSYAIGVLINLPSECPERREEGSVFRWETSSGPIVFTFREIEPPRLVAWTDRAMSIKAVHRWNLERTDGKTAVRTAESFDGALSRLFRRPLQKALKKSLKALKAEVERHPA